MNANCVHTSDSRIYCCIHQLSSNQIFSCFKVAIHIHLYIFKCIKAWSTWINSCRLTKILSMFRILCQILHLSSVYLYIYAHGIYELKKIMLDGSYSVCSAFKMNVNSIYNRCFCLVFFLGKCKLSIGTESVFYKCASA